MCLKCTFNDDAEVDWSKWAAHQPHWSQKAATKFLQNIARLEIRTICFQRQKASRPARYSKSKLTCTLFPVLFRHLDSQQLQAHLDAGYYEYFVVEKDVQVAEFGAALPHAENFLSDIQRISYLAELGLFFFGNQRSFLQRELLLVRDQVLRAGIRVYGQ